MPSVSGAGGSIDPDAPQPVEEGGTASFTLAPESGFELAAVEGSCGGALDGMVFTTAPVTADCTVIASFEPVPAPAPWTVTPSVDGPGGSIDPDAPQPVEEGGTATFTLAPESGFELAAVEGSCGGALDGMVFTTAPVTADCTVIARFVPDTPPFPHPYCVVHFPEGIEPITRVHIRSIDHAGSIGSPFALEDVLHVQAPVSLGGHYRITVEGTTGGAHTSKVRVFVDWDQDGGFEGADEVFELSDLVDSDGTDGRQASGIIHVPPTASPGATRMRVLKRFATAADACNESGSGQGMDFTLLVDDLPVASPGLDVEETEIPLIAIEGGVAAAALDIGNNGGPGSLLEYQARRDTVQGRAQPAAREAAIRGNDRQRLLAMSQDARISRANGALVQGHAPVRMPLAGHEIAQTAELAPEPDNGIACRHGPTGRANDNSWWRRFYFAEHPEVLGPNVTISAVRIASEMGPPTPATVNVYTIPAETPVDTIEHDALTLIGTGSGVVGGALNLTEVAISDWAIVSDIHASDLVVEYRIEGSSGVFSPGGTSAPESHPTFMSTLTCDVPEPTPVALVGFPDFHLVMGVTVEEGGEPPGVCELYADEVPWLSLSPVVGGVPAGESVRVDVHASADDLPPGLHEAMLCVASNDPERPHVEIPLALEVLPAPPPEVIFQDGFE